MNPAFLNQPYNRNTYQNFVQNFLLDFAHEESTLKLSANSLFTSAQILGHGLDDELAIIEINSDPNSAGGRIAITKEAFTIMRDHGIGNALIAFSGNQQDWRLSLLTTSLKLNERGKVTSQVSNPRRYSYLLGIGAKTVTPYKYLIEKGSVANIKQLQERFSVEVVNKQFYSSVADLFTKLVGGERGKSVYPGILKIKGEAKHSPEHQEFAVRLIGRIIFCWFLKQKKSNSGKPIIADELFSLDAIENNNNYYHSVLEPLFFETLNKRFEERDGPYRQGKFAMVPFLNGGLFSPQTGSSGDYYNDNNATSIKDQWFKELFTLFEQYNFTVDENTNYDVDLSIDPEMLGRIFENLLAEINPETGESARKATGSFYTPREIVDYMVDSSLLEFLNNKTDIEEAKLKALISWGQQDDQESPLSTPEKETIVDELACLRILDPACGSGAFPIGILQKIVYILQQVDGDGRLWLKKQLAYNASPEFRYFLEKQNYDYVRKLGVIRESIYGVDIQPIATEISKLRCFLTLVIEGDVSDDMSENRHIEPLPNLEFKFITANSLVGLEDTTKMALGSEKLIELESKLFDLRTNEYFQPKTPQEKEDLKIRDKQLCNEILLATAGVVNKDEKLINSCSVELKQAKDLLAKLDTQYIERTQSRLFGGDDVIQLKLLSQEEEALRNRIRHLKSSIRKEQAKSNSQELANKLQQIISWNPYLPGIKANFFDPKWMFGVDGFDIVIANPPYVDYRKIDDDHIKNTYKIAEHSKMINLYTYFYELGLSSIVDGGVLCYISPQQYLVLDNCKGLRDLIRQYTLVSLSDYSMANVFTAGTYPFVTVIRKDMGYQSAIFREYDQIEDPQNYIRQQTLPNPITEPVDISEFGGILTKMANSGRTLIDICETIFVASSSTQDRLSVGVGKYKFVEASNVLRNSIDKITSSINQTNSYSSNSIKQQTGNIIFTSRMTDVIRAALIDNSDAQFLGGKVNVVKPFKNSEYVVSLLNSKAVNFWFRQRFGMTHMQGGALPINAADLKKIPLPRVTEEQLTRLIKLYNEQLYDEVDKLVYQLYNLTPEEIAVVEAS